MKWIIKISKTKTIKFQKENKILTILDLSKIFLNTKCMNYKRKNQQTELH